MKKQARSDSAKKGWAAQTPEQRAERSRKTQESRRRNALTRRRATRI